MNAMISSNARHRLRTALAEAMALVSVLSAPVCLAADDQKGFGIKPIRGTWLNLFYQDARNRYTNPQDVEMTSPELWRRKIKEMSEMGVEYLIFMAVANEGKAMYESDFLPRAYPAGRESPVRAIMKAADENKMKVFMAFGWAINQDDDMSIHKVRSLHLRIMRECASKFAGHASFHGWYFPCEFSAAPRIPDVAIQEVNVRAALARKLTPKAKLMISPYTVDRAEIDQQYVAQLAKLNVDIIAYQDGVGCAFAFEPKLKETFRKLRWAHNQVPRVALWANVETFSWEGLTNKRDSALVPAAFPRVLSQMSGASPHVDETVCFIVQGMFDKPGSVTPVGQSIWSEKLAANYMEFLAGKGRWPLLAASFAGKLTNQAAGKPVSLARAPSPKYDKGNLTDGLCGDENMFSERWLGFENGDLEAVIDLGQSIPIKSLGARFLQYAPACIQLPSRVEFAVSEDGKAFKPAAAVEMEKWPHDKHDYWIDMAVAGDLREQGRYVRVRAAKGGPWLFVDELLVNPNVNP